jgi:hypothetical protein
LFQWSVVVWTLESNKYTISQNMIQTLRQVSDADFANLTSYICYIIHIQTLLYCASNMW